MVRHPGMLGRLADVDFVCYQLSCPRTWMLCLERSLVCLPSEVAQSNALIADVC
jgi:hypothetical protein